MFRLENSARGRPRIGPFLQLDPAPTTGASPTRVIGAATAEEHSGPVVGIEARGRQLVVSSRGCCVSSTGQRMTHPAAPLVFISDTRVRVDGMLGGHEGLGYSDEPERSR